MPRDPAITSRIMAAVPAQDTKPELQVRKALWHNGYRYRTNVASIVGKPDIVFRKERVAVFIDGDFWHGNEWRRRNLSCPSELFPTRTEWWVQKIEKNVERDRVITRELQEAGWRVLRFWTSTVLEDLPSVVADIADAVDNGERLDLSPGSGH